MALWQYWDVVVGAVHYGGSNPSMTTILTVMGEEWYNECVMRTILSQIKAVRMLSRDWHYNASGRAFYGEHLLADLVLDETEQSDALIETFFLGEKTMAPPSQCEIAREALSLIDKVKGERQNEGVSDNALFVKTLLSLTAAHAEEISRTINISIGTKSIIDSISASCYKLIGLIERMLKQ